jgi:hypothetical protein
MGQAVPRQHPAVVLRSHYKQLRALLAVAMIAVVGLTAAVVILATDDDRDTSAGSATQVSAPSPAGGTRYDGGPEGAPAASSPPASRASATTAAPTREPPRSPSARHRPRSTPTRSRARPACATTAAPRRAHAVRSPRRARPAPATTAAPKRAPAARRPPTRPRTPCRAPATTAAPRKAAGAATTSPPTPTDSDERAPRSGGPVRCATPRSRSTPVSPRQGGRPTPPRDRRASGLAAKRSFRTDAGGRRHEIGALVAAGFVDKRASRSTPTGLSQGTTTTSPAHPRADASFPMRAALSAFGRCVARAPRKSAPLLRPNEHQGVRQNAIDCPMRWRSGRAASKPTPGNRELRPTGHLFPSLCFPPSVSLYGFLP